VTISSSGGLLTISNCTISNNQGGAIENLGDATIVNSTLIGNTSSQGAGIYNSGSSAMVLVENTTISGNRAEGGSTSRGGGIYNDRGNATIRATTLSANFAEGDGGAIYNTSLSIAQTTFLTNVTVSGNSANGSGGGVFNTNAATTLLLRNTTMLLNRADADGNGSGTGGGLNRANGSVTLHGSILSDNQRGTSGQLDEISGTVQSASSYNFIQHTTSAGGLENGVNGNLVGVSSIGVISGTLQDNGGPTRTHRLLSGGAAVDAVELAACVTVEGAALTVDQRGMTRPRGTRCDIGAFERQPGDP
jgi:predicted outer membrane repeat protein